MSTCEISFTGVKQPGSEADYPLSCTMLRLMCEARPAQISYKCRSHLQKLGATICNMTKMEIIFPKMYLPMLKLTPA
jgi:hypothetical protein